METVMGGGKRRRRKRKRKGRRRWGEEGRRKGRGRGPGEGRGSEGCQKLGDQWVAGLPTDVGNLRTMRSWSAKPQIQLCCMFMCLKKTKD